MWANAQRDGRPAEYRWRPLFNAVDIQSTAAEIRRGKKKERKKEEDRNHRAKI